MENLIALDIEIYRNYSLFAFKSVDTGNTFCIEIVGSDEKLNETQSRQLRTILTERWTFGFNSRNYDVPIIFYALGGAKAFDLYKMSCHIIYNESPTYTTLKKFNVTVPSDINHFDIQEPAPDVNASLKMYGARLNTPKLQDLPYDPESILAIEQMKKLKEYCINDLDITIALYLAIKDRIDLRYKMSKKYGINLLSKSDAQISEAVIKSKLGVGKVTVKKAEPFRYEIPDFIKFESDSLNKVKELVKNTVFDLDNEGKPIFPKEFTLLDIKIGYARYKLGLGGLHSRESAQSIIPTDEYRLVDRDVTSYYPSIILNQGLYPVNLGKGFLDIFSDFKDERVEAKRILDILVSAFLKIVLNGGFGKFGSIYSALYSPNLLIATTMTGQLSLLMLIERLENEGIRVVSANTDGFVTLLKKERYNMFDKICSDWEKETNLNLEETEYKAMFSRDVNAYIAPKIKGGFKGTSLFSEPSLRKTPQVLICAEAVREYLLHNIPLAETIRGCRDITKFLFIKKVTGGATYNGEYLGKVVRWYYIKQGLPILYKSNGNKVGNSDSCKPMMTLCDFPSDVDYDRYIKEAKSILESVGISDSNFLFCGTGKESECFVNKRQDI